jgi:hypothetical protein
MGGDANLAKHVAWELQEGPMERSKCDGSSGSGPRPVVSKNGHDELAPEKHEEHIPTGNVFIVKETPNAQQLVLL